MLEYHIERLKWSGIPVIVATTTNQTDDRVADLCQKLDVSIFRGDEGDMLSRYLAAKEHSLNIVIRVTSDCPLMIDGNMVKQGLQTVIIYQQVSFAPIREALTLKSFHFLL